RDLRHVHDQAWGLQAPHLALKLKHIAQRKWAFERQDHNTLLSTIGDAVRQFLFEHSGEYNGIAARSDYKKVNMPTAVVNCKMLQLRLQLEKALFRRIFCAYTQAHAFYV